MGVVLCNIALLTCRDEKPTAALITPASKLASSVHCLNEEYTVEYIMGINRHYLRSYLWYADKLVKDQEALGHVNGRRRMQIWH